MELYRDLIERSKEWFKVAGITNEDLITQYNVLLTEFAELINSKDEVSILDACSDILFVGSGISYLTESDQIIKIVLESIHRYTKLNEDIFINYMDAVIESNFTKFDKDQESVEKTIDKYKALGIELDVCKVNDWYIYLAHKDYYSDTLGVIPKGKILKSINYKTPLKIIMERNKL